MAANQPGFQIAAAIIRASERFPHRELIDTLSGSSAADGLTLTIAVSREVGAQGTAVASEVGRMLSWPVFDHELLEEIAKDLHVGIRQVEYVDERPGNWLEESVEAFASSRAVTEITYFVHLRDLLQTLGSRGRCVIVGRGAAHLLPAANTLRVRIQAPLADRIANISRERTCSPAEAARFIETETERRRQFIENHFHRDPADPQHYDLVLDSSRFSVIACAKLIVNGFRNWSEQSLDLDLRLKDCHSRDAVAARQSESSPGQSALAE